MIDPPGHVYVAFEAFPKPKGAATHIAVMIRALARRDGPVWLLCCGYGDMPALQVEGNIVIRRYKMHHPNMLRRAVGFGEFVYETLSSLPAPPAICMFRDPWGGRAALDALRGTPGIFEVNALPSWELAYRYPAWGRNVRLREKIGDIERSCLADSAAILTVSSVTARALRDMGVDGGKIRIVPNAASDWFFSAHADAADVPELNEGRWFGYFGSLHPWQGVDMLLRSWSRVADDLPDWRMIVVHTGRKAWAKGCRKRIRKLGMADRVLLHAPMPPQALAPTVSRLALTCAPLTETFRNTAQGCCPIKIVESMAAGVPVLASDLQVARDLISPGRDGYLVAPGDERRWALALRDILGDDAGRQSVARAARRTAERLYTHEIAFGRLDALFRATLAQRRDGRRQPHPTTKARPVP